VENWFSYVVALAVQYLEDLVRVEELAHFLLVGFLLALVPVPLVHLGGFEASELAELLHELARPVLVPEVLVLQDLHLFFILSATLFLL